MNDEIYRFDETLFDNVELLRVNITELKSDDIIEELFEIANPIAGLRTSHESIDKSAYICIFRDDLASDFGMSRPPISVSSGH